MVYGYDTGTRQQTVVGRREGATFTVYAYDALGNVTSVTDPTGVRTDYTYEANSHRVASETTGAGTTLALTRTYGYDAKGFRTVESYTINGKTTTTTSTYTDTVRDEHVLESTVAADGTRTEQTYSPQDGTLTQSVVKDSAGAMREKTTFVHDVRGNLLSSTRWARGTNGVWQAYAQSANIYANGRVTRFQSPGEFWILPS